jgi:hypothetical protein
MEEAEVVGDGMYRVTKDFEQDGLYFVKIHASSSGSTIVPTQQFIVGELSTCELQYLQKGQKPEGEAEEHHH